MTRTYYHATDFSNLESIMQKGLIAGVDGYIYLTETPEDALKFMRLRFLQDILVVAVDLEEELVSESFDHSERFFKCKAYKYPEDIQTYDISEFLRCQLGV